MDHHWKGKVGHVLDLMASRLHHLLQIPHQHEPLGMQKIRIRIIWLIGSAGQTICERLHHTLIIKLVTRVTQGDQHSQACESRQQINILSTD